MEQQDQNQYFVRVWQKGEFISLPRLQALNRGTANLCFPLEKRASFMELQPADTVSHWLYSTIHSMQYNSSSYNVIGQQSRKGL